MSKKVGVALVKEACRVCGKEMDGPIIMNTRLTEKNAKEVEDLHGKILGYAKDPCEECKKSMEQGFMLIGYIDAKTKDRDNPWRSGHIWVIKDEKAAELFGINVVVKGYALIDIEVAREIGLPVQDLTPKGSA